MEGESIKMLVWLIILCVIEVAAIATILMVV